MFKFFESRIDIFPESAPATPPRTLLRFLLHFSRPLLPWIGAVAVLTALRSIAELTFIAFLGGIVDWLTSADQATFLPDRGGELAAMAALVVVGYPTLVLLQSLIHYQTVFGNQPMLARWLMHRYVLKQSLSFFQNEFAGRVATKVMQTAQAVRDVLDKIVEVFVYVIVYFIGAIILVAKADTLLIIPLVLWLVGYVGIVSYFVPRMRKVSEAQANARAVLTGRVVDSYTNIQTVKLFAHARREENYARSAMVDFMGTVYPMFRLTTRLNVSLEVLNALLLASIAGVAIYAWTLGAVSLGAIAVGAALALRIRSTSQWIVWEVSGLFEEIGVVQDGLHTIAQPLAVTDKPDARDLEVTRGEIRFENIRFHYGRDAGVIEDLSLTIAPGEKVGLVGRSGAGKSTLVNLLLRFFDLEGGRILIDGQDVADVTQESLRRRIGLVTQDTSLLHRSIRDNILYGSPEASEADIIEAAQRAHADEFIRSVADPDGHGGYDAHVGERGRQALRRSATAHRHRPGVPQERADPHPGRGHVVAGFGGRGGDPGTSPDADGRQDRHRHRASPVDDRHARPAGGDGSGPHRRDRDASRTAGARRHLCPALASPVRRVPRRCRREGRASGGRIDGPASGKRDRSFQLVVAARLAGPEPGQGIGVDEMAVHGPLAGHLRIGAGAAGDAPMALAELLRAGAFLDVHRHLSVRPAQCAAPGGYRPVRQADIRRRRALHGEPRQKRRELRAGIDLDRLGLDQDAFETPVQPDLEDVPFAAPIEARGERIVGGGSRMDAGHGRGEHDCEHKGQALNPTERWTIAIRGHAHPALIALEIIGTYRIRTPG